MHRRDTTTGTAVQLRLPCLLLYPWFNYDILLAKEEALKEIASFVEINDTFIKIKDDSFYVSDSIILKLL